MRRGNYTHTVCRQQAYKLLKGKSVEGAGARSYTKAAPALKVMIAGQVPCDLYPNLS